MSEAPVFSIVAIASSAGGVAALSSIVAQLPENFAVPVVIVQHLDPHHRSLLAEILAKGARLAVKQASDGDPIEAGTVYIAPPDRHLLVSPDMRVTLADTELVHFVRPSADLLFESVAACCRERALAVVLTGSGSDGALGVTAVKKMGGTVIAQNEATSAFFGMPGAAIATGHVDFILPLDDIPGALVKLVCGGTHD
jgi:two-component system chemotaxis response regulator CheB